MTTSVGRYTVARTWELTPRLISAFAAGVGDANPCYLDDSRPDGLVAHPGLTFTFQWNTRHMPGVPIDPVEARLGVHAWADVRFTRPLRQGDVITAQGQIIADQDTPPGRLVVTRVTMRDASGAEVAVMDSGGISRGVHTGRPDAVVTAIPPWPECPAPAGDPLWVSEFDIPFEAAHTYTECADIWNPIHTEQAVAKAAGLPGIILHGSATMSIAVREVVNHSLGGRPESIRRFAGQFRAMVIPGQPVTVRGLAEREGPDGREVFFDLLNAAGQVAISRGVVVAG